MELVTVWNGQQGWVGIPGVPGGHGYIRAAPESSPRPSLAPAPVLDDSPLWPRRANGRQLVGPSARERVLWVLKQDGRRWAPRALALRCGLDPSTCATLVSRFRKQGLVEPVTTRHRGTVRLVQAKVQQPLPMGA